MKDNFNYIVEEFADIMILRFKVPEFDKLSFKEKQFIYYLSEASLWGLDITWLQFGKSNLLLRRTLENIIKTYSGEKEDNYNKFIEYAKRVFFSYGFHHHYNKHKFYPDFSKEAFIHFLDKSDINGFELSDKSFSKFKEDIIDLIYSDEENKKDLLLDDYTDFYENVSEKEAKKYYNDKSDKNNKNPISFGLNTKLIKNKNNIEEIPYSENGLYSDYIKKIIYYLDKALDYAQNDNQVAYTKILIDYYKTGDLKKWDEYNIAWVKDNKSSIDYISGFVEVYDDPIGYKGTYEGSVYMEDEETTRITNIIASNAEWFERNSPIDPRFKKEKINGVKAKGIHVITLSGCTYPSAPIGINLPNADWIREQYGSKSVTITNLTNAYDNADKQLPLEKKKEFVYSDEELDLEEKYGDIGDDLHTHLHECLGHGSGRLLEGVPANALKEYYSALEEARADIFALYYMADSKLLELNICPSPDLAKAYYSLYIRGGLEVQLTRVLLGKDIVEAHMVARKLISTWSYEKAKKDNVIEKIIKDNKTYFVVNDYLKLREIFKELLIELQRIKSTGDYEAGKSLVLNYGVKIDYDLHKEVLERYEKLNLKPYKGFVNPKIVPIIQDNKIIDFKIEYAKDFLSQILEYNNNYSIKKN